MQAGITVDWSKEDKGDHIAILSRRVYDYTNHVLGLNIKEDGQEDLMSIQYFGRGENDTEPDRYGKTIINWPFLYTCCQMYDILLT
jgi:hypothetical protein